MNSYLVRLQSELNAATDGATDDAMRKCPSGKWNATQIMEHLYLTYKNTNKGIGRCLEGGKPLATTSTMAHRMKRLVVVGLGYLPEGAKAPERAVPRGMSLEEVRKEIHDEIQKMAAGLDDCEHRFGASTRIMDHPILGPLTAEEWRRFHWLHGRHHARQIRERTTL